MVHLLPLPGSPRARSMNEVLSRALADADTLLEAGFDGLVVENYGDTPFLPGAVSPVTVAAMSRVVSEILARTAGKPVCVNVLRNDALSALAIATACGAGAIRVNVHAGTRVTDQGLLSGRAGETLRARAAWGSGVAIWADVDVKHSTGVGNPPRPLGDQVADVVARGHADAVIVTGSATGAMASPDCLHEVRAASGAAAVLVGSGVTEGTVHVVLGLVDGAIVGTSVKEGGRTTAPVDPARARAMAQAAG